MTRPNEPTQPLCRGATPIVLVLGLFLAACFGAVGCDKDKSPRPPTKRTDTDKPTLRIYAVSGAAGAIEPCGCVKDMLGGVDHLAAFIESQKSKAPNFMVVGAGPMFFEDPMLSGNHATQAGFKAEAMAQSLRDLGMVAWAPGANDWADGFEAFGSLSRQTGATPLAANLSTKTAPLQATQILKVGNTKIGLVGISIPQRLKEGVSFQDKDPSKAFTSALEALTKQGAHLTVALIAAPRGAALRMIEQIQGKHLVQVAVLGKPFDQGEGNDAPFSPELVGDTLVIQGPNHLQSVAIVDLIVRGTDHRFTDGSGLELSAKRRRLEGRIQDLKQNIEEWKVAGSKVRPEDLKAQMVKLSRMQNELASLPTSQVPAEGSYFLYDLVEIHESLGEDPQVSSRLKVYYKRVNGHNKQAFADRLPVPPEDGEASYVGVDACTRCHEEERAVWNKTRHAVAYETLVVDDKQYNLDCVSCHVTGYEKPGGSTVTHVERLTAVQCEVCHGPGSLHVDKPLDPKLIRRAPAQDLCATSCHHPPHVGEKWTTAEAWPKILGPGHGF